MHLNPTMDEDDRKVIIRLGDYKGDSQGSHLVELSHKVGVVYHYPGERV